LEGTEELDVPTFKKHIINLASAGMGVLVAGSMGEAHHLEPEERIILIRAAREALDSIGLTHVPVIAGTGIGSTKGTIEITRQAAEAGADYSIVIASGYYAGALNNEALVRFFVEVAAASPIPVIVYNCMFLAQSLSDFHLT
jgi:4-hydroxy-2-oxoglutarate aldolase